MAHWQARADMLSGGVLLFGIKAEDREAAQTEILLRLDGTGAIGVQLREIPLPEDR